MPAPNNAFVYCTGPVELFVRFSENGWTNPLSTLAPAGQIYYLGTCEGTPEIDEQPQEKPIYTAQGGDMVSFDDMYMGKLLQANMNLQRFSQAILQRVQDAPLHGRGGSVIGMDAFGERGAMMLAQGLRFELWMYNSFWPALNVVPDMHPGLYFPAAKTIRVFRPTDGLAPSHAQLSVEAKPVWRTSAAPNGGTSAGLAALGVGVNGGRGFWHFSMAPADFADIIAGNVIPG